MSAIGTLEKIPKPDEVRDRLAENRRHRALLKRLLELSEKLYATPVQNTPRKAGRSQTSTSA